ncbi:MAG: RDD family protein [Micromonosporaceae bacterium]|nr:RDD family protein [Micromonosporaceae bacterium]
MALALPHPPTARTGVAPVITGEAVPLDIRVARLGSRVLALLVDLILQAVLFFLLLTLGLLGLGMLAGVGLADGALVQALLIGVLVAVLIGYPTVLLTLTRGRTVGKLALGLRVVRDDGGPVGFRHSLTRTLVGAAVEFPGFVMPFGGWVVSMVLMTTSPLSKRLGDHAAGTFVIHERNLEAWGWVPAMPPGLAGWASTLDLAGLDDDLALATRHFLARNRQLREPARTRLGQQLARQVAQVTSPPPPAGTPGWAYLAAVHAERHVRALRRLAAVRGRAAAVWPELVAATEPPRPGA